jgi:hypothetical protein
MDLAQHAAVLWRFRAVVAGGLLLGTLLAVLAAYQVPSMTARGSESWSSVSSLLVTQAGFPEGRSTLPAEDPAEGTGTGATGDGTGAATALEFADPNRLSALASLYAQLATGDRVRKQLPERPKPSQIEAIAVEGNASTQLPVIQITTTAGSAEGARALNLHTVGALKKVLTTEQTRNAIPAVQRIQLDQISAPAAPVKVAGRSHTASILAFLLCVLGSIAVAHLLAALRDGREEAQALDGVVVPWATVTDSAARAEQEPFSEPEPIPAYAPEPARATWLSGRRRSR